MSTSSTDTTIKPQGIGLGVAIVWALAGQMVTMGILAFTGKHVTNRLPLGLEEVGYLIAAAICVAWGEGVRAGRSLAIWLLIGFSGILAVTAGLFGIPGTIQATQQGNLWPLYSTVILVVLFPYLFIQLIQPGTRAWMATTSAAAARARHGSPLWLAAIIACAAIGGALQAIAVVLH